MAKIIDGKAISLAIKDELKEKVAEYKNKGIDITLAVVKVGNDPASAVYVRNKEKACEYVGINSRTLALPEETTQEELLNIVRELNEDDTVNGILVQLPLPKHIDESEVLLAINSTKDVDGFHPVNVGKMVIGEDTFLPESCVNVLVQGRFMKEADKESFLSAFYEKLPEGASLAGFCVLGGIFSEGIDLKDESLIGAVIVGTGIPMVCRERNILRDYFDEFGKNGYSYAYVIPGMNKVLQAAGRVIRTDTDKGVIALLDDRFMTGEYERMYPREWNRIFPVSLGNAYKCIKDFWTEQDI